MTDVLVFATTILLVVLFLLFLILRKVSRQIDPSVLFVRLDAFEKGQERTEFRMSEEVAKSREELNKTAREQRQELTAAFAACGDTVVQRMKDVAAIQKGQLDLFSEQLAALTKASGERLDGMRAESVSGGKQLREEVVTTLNSISETMAKTMKELAMAEKAQLEAMAAAIGKLAESNEKKLEAVRVTVEARLQSMQADNAKQLDLMRQTVDEKLQRSEERRVGKEC